MLSKVLVLVTITSGILQGQVVVKGATIKNSQFGSTVTRNGFVSPVFPPGTGSADNTKWRSNVMSNPLIDGVTLQINTSNFLTSASTTADGPCAGYTVDTDTCIKQTVVDGVTLPAPVYFKSTGWGSIEQRNTPGIQSWFDDFVGDGTGFKKVSILEFSQAAGTTNTVTPAFVGTSDYINLFSPARQDVLNQINSTCPGSNWAGRTASGTAVASLVTVTLTGHGISNNEKIWVTSASDTGYNTGTAGATVSASAANTFQYTSPGTPAGATSDLVIISTHESFFVPYELPYKAYRQAAIKMLMLHFNASYSKASQLFYVRPGPSVGGETYPYCYTEMQGLAAPYTLSNNQTSTSSGSGNDCYSGGTCLTWGWSDYFNGDVKFFESLHPFMRVLTSVNVGGTGSSPRYSFAKDQTTYALARSDGANRPIGVGEQGVSLADIHAYQQNPSQTLSDPSSPNLCGNNGCDLVVRGWPDGTLVEGQPISTSDYLDIDCTTHARSGGKCAVPPNGDSGNMATWLKFYTGLPVTDPINGTTVTLLGHMNVFEPYYRDVALALDPTFYDLGAGTSYTLAPGSWYTLSYQQGAFQAVGLGNGCGAAYKSVGLSLQGSATGDCSYAAAIAAFHGPH